MILNVGLRRKKSEDLKDGERSLRRAKSGETLVEDRSDSDVRIVRYTWCVRPIDQSSSWFPSEVCACVP